MKPGTLVRPTAWSLRERLYLRRKGLTEASVGLIAAGWGEGRTTTYVVWLETGEKMACFTEDLVEITPCA